MAATLTTVTTNVKNHLDEPTSSYWSASEVTNAIVNKQLDLWRRIVAIKKSFFLTTTPSTLNLAASTNTYSLPSDFYRVHHLKMSQSGFENVRFRWFDSSTDYFIDGMRTDIVINIPDEFLYDIIGNQTIIVSPTPQQAFTVNLWYIQLPTAVVNGSDTFGVLDPFVDFIEYAATAELLKKGPVGDGSYWEMKAAEAWQNIILDLGTSRSDQGPDFVQGMFEVY